MSVPTSTPTSNARLARHILSSSSSSDLARRCWSGRAGTASALSVVLSSALEDESDACLRRAGERERGAIVTNLEQPEIGRRHGRRGGQALRLTRIVVGACPPTGRRCAGHWLPTRSDLARSAAREARPPENFEISMLFCLFPYRRPFALAARDALRAKVSLLGARFAHGFLLGGALRAQG
jgi:hypothetical protein